MKTPSHHLARQKRHIRKNRIRIHGKVFWATHQENPDLIRLALKYKQVSQKFRKLLYAIVKHDNLMARLGLTNY